MKLFRSSLLILGETAALGWFILQDISFVALLPLIPLGVLFYRLHRGVNKRWLDGVTALISVVLVVFTVSVGVFDGQGFLTLLALLIAVSLMAFKVSREELQRVSGWWMALFLTAFAAMLIATLPGVRLPTALPQANSWIDIILFYILVFAEPLALGKDFRASPLVLGILLIPFGILSYLALGTGAFSMAEYPYLSVWAGVAVSAFHHIEGIILCLFYGVGALRLAYFWSNSGFFSLHKTCNADEFIV